VRGIAIGLKKNSYFLPPVQVVIDRLLQLTEGHQAWFERKQFEAFSPSADACFSTVDVMSSLNSVYFWDFGTQRQFQVNVAKMQLGDAYSPLASLILDRDCGGPQDIFGATYPDMPVVAA
jgi:hypothetical protein